MVLYLKHNLKILFANICIIAIIYTKYVFCRQDSDDYNIMKRISKILKMGDNNNNLLFSNRNLSYSNGFNNFTQKNPLILKLKDDDDISDFIEKLLKLCNAKTDLEYHVCFSLFSRVYEFLKNNTNITLIDEHVLGNQDCRNQVINLSSDSYENFMEIFGDSGKTLQDYGLEEDCIVKGHNYYFIKLKISSENVLGDESISTMNKFLNLTDWSLGLCFFRNCSEFVLNFGNEDINEPFFSYLKSVGITDFEISLPKRTFEYTQVFIYFGYFFISYVSLKLICSFLFIFLKKYRKGTINSKRDLNDDEEFDSINNDDNPDNSYSQYTINEYLEGKNILDNNRINNSSISNTLLNNRNKNAYFINIQKYLSFFYEFFSFQTNYEHLVKPKSEYYDDSSLESINLCKFLLLFLGTFNHIFYTSIKLPHRDFFNKSLFNSAIFGYYKLSTYSIDCLIILEAMTMTFKLMKYIKLNGPYLKTFIKFYSFCIPKIALFFIIYFIFHINFENFGNLITPNAMFERFLIEKFKTKTCYGENPYVIFDLLNFCYKDISPRAYTTCFKFAYFYINIFLSFNIIMLIIYFSLKIKRRIFDLIVTTTFFGFMMSILYYLFQEEEKVNYTFSYLLTEVISYKTVHLCVVHYFLGVLLGLFYFYNSELTLNDSYINSDNHLPFKYVYHYSVFLNLKTKDFSDNYLKDFTKNRTFRRYGVLLTSIFIMLILIFYFPLKLLIMGSNDILIPFSLDLRIIYFFEKFLFGFAFIKYLSSLRVLAKNNMVLKAFSGSKLFSVFGRISLPYFCMNDTIVYIFFALYNIQFYFNYQNLFFLTIGLVTLISIISFIIVYLFELPIRKLIKNISARFY